MEKQENIVLFTAKGDEDVTLNVRIQDETVWLNRQQMAELFDRDVKTIGKHIANALKEELDDQVVVANFATTTKHGAIKGKTQTHMTEYYNLDVIISVGYRVKSKRGVEFRRWANNILRKYILDGYALNEKRLKILQKTVDIQNRMLSSAMNIEQSAVLKAVSQYSKALGLLDNYDHQNLKKPGGEKPTYRITYEECQKMVLQMKGTFDTDVFGVEREEGKVEGIIAASLFLEFLDRNNALFRNGQKIISDGELVAITLMIAESLPEEKETMTTMVMNFLTM